ncbi:hypothetical protein [Rhodovulum marinum]|uniref:Uncharacterized protein n=1 Tax=Rhodovulum marinum TaxID=320662 RepID=A0A4R2PVT8_9RHOB|nr:hypothetical protein [Rhodovulum marinum]TCP40140.1 hypothetical protein EV662_10814 [Rhodovulum marinum]
MTKKEHIRLGRVTETSIRNALLYIRAECLRDGAEGLEHVDALLRLRGHDPEAFGFAEKRPKAFKKGELRRLIVKALREGPKTGKEIAEAVRSHHGGLTEVQAYRKVYSALDGMKKRGVVIHLSPDWRLASD